MLNLQAAWSEVDRATQSRHALAGPRAIPLPAC